VLDIHIPTLIRADARRIPLADGSVQCVVTSPPYWNLRKYAGAQDGVWGGSPECEHRWGEEKKVRQTAQRDHARGGGFSKTRGTEAARKGMAFEASQGSFCPVCGAWKGAYGFEPSAALYVSHTVEILREIRRVLKPGGVVFWNVGDSYVKKSLALVPDRVAIAAQDDGWVVRSEIIWVKPDAMPRSVKDRPTDAHERILMLTKNPRYYWNADALREPARTKDCAPDGKRNGRNVWEMCVSRFKGAHFATFPEELPRRCILAASRPGDLVLDPFGGSGTTGKVAMELGRRSVLLDINYTGEDGSYDELARRRFQKAVEKGATKQEPTVAERISGVPEEAQP
jgi:site-specific DNA-methyltransferase (adenine-specific)